MSSRISTFVLLAILTLFVGGCDDAPLPPPKPPVKIAIVNCGQRFYPLIKMFKQRLSDLDHLEGRDVIFLYDGPIATDQLREKLQYLKTQDIGLLFTITTPVTRVAHEIFKDTNVPIVFGPVFSPVDDGLTSSLTRPDKNMTGVMIRGNTARAFGFLIESMPSLKSLSVPFPCNESTSRLSIEDLREVAEKHNVTVVTTNIKTEADLNDYLLHLPKETEAIWLPHSPFIMNHLYQITSAANAKKIPVASATSQFNYGTMLAYGPDLVNLGKQTGRLAHKILEGEPVSNLPVEQCEYYLSVNLEVAHQAGVTIPKAIVWQASEITYKLVDSTRQVSEPPVQQPKKNNTSNTLGHDN